MKTLQEQYNQIQKGEGRKDLFLKEARRHYPNLVSNLTSYNDAEKILKNKSVINEEIGGVVTLKPVNTLTSADFNPNKESWENKFEQFLAEAGKKELNPIVNNEVEKKMNDKAGDEKIKAEEKETAKEVVNTQDRNYDYSPKVDNINNVNAQEMMNGVYCEIKADPNLSLEEAQAKVTSVVNATNKAKPDSDTIIDAQQTLDHYKSEKIFYQWMKSETDYKTKKENYKKELKKKNPDISDADLYEKVSHMKVHDHAWYAKKGYLSKTSWSIRWIFCFVSWGVFTWLIRKNSIAQDKDGLSKWTSYNRKLAAAGIFVFAVTTTTAAIDGMKALEHQWFSTMYGVYYFAGSFWISLITMYLICLFLKNKGPLKDVVRKETFKDLGTLFFAFTVFYSYIHFSQYFLIWNAAIPEETFWYVKREQGPWWNVGMVILFGHFFIPFLTLLRQDVKTKPIVMITIGVIAWYVHFCDMSYNVMPLIHEAGGWMSRIWIDLGCMLFMGGYLAMLFIYFFNKNAPYPQKDPRIAETMGVYVRLNSELQNSGK